MDKCHFQPYLVKFFFVVNYSECRISVTQDIERNNSLEYIPQHNEFTTSSMAQGTLKNGNQNIVEVRKGLWNSTY